jgi:hypothetical protein
MPNIPRDYVLRDGQRGRPFVWVEQARILERIPDVSNPALAVIFGDGASRRLKSWGHAPDTKVHWLATRSGTNMHTDPTYKRYTHHLILRNDGWRTHGMDDSEKYPMLVPGMMTCLDAWSPHQVTRDERFGVAKPLYKVQLAVDRDEPLTPEEVWALLSPWLTRNPIDDAHTVRAGASPQ